MQTLLIVLVGVASYTLFYWLFVHDVLNRIQYLERLRLYWITRDNGEPDTPFYTKAFMRQVAAPFWRGNGVQFRFGKYTFQIGILQMKADSLESQISGNQAILASAKPQDFRKW